MSTKSEDLFEQFCTENNIRFSKIAEASQKTPDYQIGIDGCEIVVEVKQIDPSKEDKKLIEQLNTTGMMSHGGTPGNRIRSKIEKSVPQLANLAKNKFPAMLVIYNNLPFDLGDPTEHYFIEVAMFGLQLVIVNIPHDPKQSPKIMGDKFGPKRKMTVTDNTTVSALSILDKNRNNELSLRVYHNHFAAIPLSHGIFKSIQCCEYFVPTEKGDSFIQWEQVNS